MKLSLRSLGQTACALVLILFGAGCGGKTQEYYQLNAATSGGASRSGGMSVGVGPISLPAYVDRSELVYQSGDNSFQVPGNASWIGSLHENVTRVLVENLGSDLGSANVVTYPWPAGVTPTYSVSADVRQFHAISGDDAILEVAWRVRAGDRVTHHGVDTFREPIQGDGYSAVVAAESRLLAQFAQRIARSLGR